MHLFNFSSNPEIEPTYQKQQIFSLERKPYQGTTALMVDCSPQLLSYEICFSAISKALLALWHFLGSNQSTRAPIFTF